MRFIRAVSVLLALTTLTATGCLANPLNTGQLFDPVTQKHREPGVEEDVCDVEDEGLYEIDTSGTPTAQHVVEKVCITHGTIIIDADYVTLRSSFVEGYPVDNSDNESPACDPTGQDPGYCDSYFQGIVVTDGHVGVKIHDNTVDCGGDISIWPDASSHGITGNNVRVTNNEIRDCSDGIIMGENSYYGFNLIRLPDNCDNHPTPPDPEWCDIHADGVQWSTLDNGDPIGNVVFEWNTINFPLASSSFQYHGGTDPDEGPYNIAVRYNLFEGGGWVVRLPRYDNGGLAFYGNRLNTLDPAESGVCTSFETNGTDVIDVWGSETGDPTDSLPPGNPDSVVDDENIDLDTSSVLERAECE